MRMFESQRGPLKLRGFRGERTLDAAFFHLYLGSEDEWCRQPEALTKAVPAPRDVVSCIMETLPIVKCRDKEKYASYRTKFQSLAMYDRMQEPIATGRHYESILSPSPADRTTGIRNKGTGPPVACYKMDFEFTEPGASVA